MQESYFRRVAKLTPTRFWINNPSREQADLAIAAGAVGCTNNPSYCQKILDHPLENEYAMKLLEEAIRETDSDSQAEVVLQRKLVKTIAEKFLPIFKNDPENQGFVSIQGDPINEDDPNVVINEAVENRKILENICCKVPTTAAGLKAMEVLVEEKIPINATEVMGVRQAIDICEVYERVARKTGKYPKMYMSHIVGIYDDYLKMIVEREKIDISPDVLFQAGLAVARKVYSIMQERGYHAVFVGGGARGLHHFTEMVGGDVCITINWEGTADKLLELDPPVIYRLFNPVPQRVIDELLEKLPDFKKGYLENGLEVEEYEHFGPVVHFRNSFIKSWKRVLEILSARRKELQ